MSVRSVLMRMTRLLWPLGFGRPPEPPTEDADGGAERWARPENEPRPPRHTEIPPEQQPGGGPPHR